MFESRSAPSPDKHHTRSGRIPESTVCRSLVSEYPRPVTMASPLDRVINTGTGLGYSAEKSLARGALISL